MDWRLLVNFIPRLWLGIKYMYEYLPTHVKTPQHILASIIYFLIDHGFPKYPTKQNYPIVYGVNLYR